ncbi:MAG TPA: hypothetical protein VLB84_12325 [Bacteroidia bacterium]|nr:hypothetical protein [Bacteroidia bacterium]
MSSIPENKRLSLTECKKILNANGILYTDEEVIEIRNWMYHMAEIVFETMEKEETKQINEPIYKQAA